MACGGVEITLLALLCLVDVGLDRAVDGFAGAPEVEEVVGDC